MRGSTLESAFQLDPYGTLGVPKDASLADIRSAHRKMVLKCHPDRFQDPALKAQKSEEFHQVQLAYETLGDPTKREKHDRRVRVAALRDDFRDGPPRRQGDGPPRRQEKTYSSRSDPSSSSKASSTSKSPNVKITLHQQSILLNEFRRSGGLSRARCRELAIQNGLPEKTVRNWLQMRGVEHPVSQSSRTDKENAEVKQDSGQLPWNTGQEKQLLKDRNTITGLEGRINGTPVCALPDTGADFNFMAAAFAKDLCLKVTHYSTGQEPSFVMGHGRTIKAMGELTVTWQFKEEPNKSYDIVIYILPDCIFDVMIGAAFLYATKTMSAHRDRLSYIPRPRRALGTRFVNLCGLPARRIQGTLNNKECTALPDSGAEPNLLSYKYVKKRGWLLDMYPGPDSCRLLQFADGSTERTEGRLKLQWSFNKRWELASSDTPMVVTFDVLRGCPFDVILGEDFLQESEVFAIHNEAFVDVSVEGAGGINMVIFAADFLRSTLTPRSKMKTHSAGWIDDFKPDDLHQELERRAIADRTIATMKNHPTTHARELAKEAQRRKDWEKDHPVVPLKPPAPSTPTLSSSNAHAPGVLIEPSTSKIPNQSSPEVDYRGISHDPFDALKPNRMSPKSGRPNVPPERPDTPIPGQSSHTASRIWTSEESISSNPRRPTLRRMRKKFWDRTSEDMLE